MSFTVRQLADLVQGQVVGDGERLVLHARTLAEAREGDISFLEHDKYLPQLLASQASVIVVSPNIPIEGRTLIQAKDPLAAFVAIVKKLQNKPELTPMGIDPRAAVHPSAQVGADPSIGPFAAIGEHCIVGARCRIHPGAVIGPNCKLGDDVVIYPNAVLYEGVVLGDRVIVHANTVLGADGFGYRFRNGKHVKVAQLGAVEVGNDVEIGSCTTIDRGAFQATRIGEGTKIDNLVQIAHNCNIGKHNLLISQMGIAGSSSTGDYVVIAGQVGITDHVHIGEKAVIGAKAGVTKDIPAGQRTLGAPATPERDQKRILISLEKLPEMRKDIRKIKQQLGMDIEKEEG
ncbi:MAG: UDP-3-O-(3-hydroxymyristoyl)glucosamine N-acyltransferase [Gemmataceae bacterium]|nr:UDP-3-O-(3-hydroxymyristoyl)glucosamine N-acyltransferase [Gemmataceae bacterium]